MLLCPSASVPLYFHRHRRQISSDLEHEQRVLLVFCEISFLPQHPYISIDPEGKISSDLEHEQRVLLCSVRPPSCLNTLIFPSTQRAKYRVIWSTNIGCYETSFCFNTLIFPSSQRAKYRVIWSTNKGCPWRGKPTRQHSLKSCEKLIAVRK